MLLLPWFSKGNPLQCSCLRIPWTEEPGGQQSTGLQRTRQDRVTNDKHSRVCEALCARLCVRPVGAEAISHRPLASPKANPPGLQSRKSWGLTSPSLGPQLSAPSPCSQGRASATCSLPSLCLVLNSAASLPFHRLLFLLSTVDCGISFLLVSQHCLLIAAQSVCSVTSAVSNSLRPHRL